MAYCEPSHLRTALGWTAAIQPLTVVTKQGPLHFAGAIAGKIASFLKQICCPYADPGCELHSSSAASSEPDLSFHSKPYDCFHAHFSRSSFYSTSQLAA